MAKEKKRILGELAAYEVSWVAKMLTGENLDPRRINPYRETVLISAATEALKKADDKAGFRAGLRGLFKKQKG